jgi:hypothetical protein
MRAFALTLLLAIAYSHRLFLKRLPNHELVPCVGNDCKTQYCQAFGHTDCNFAINDKNQFGDDFDADSINGIKVTSTQWSVPLCLLDSDGDMKSNGDELGDPCCRWVPGQTPDRTTLISHPGNPGSITAAPSCTFEPPGLVEQLNVTAVESSDSYSFTFDWNPSTFVCVCNYTLTVNTENEQITISGVSQPPFTLCVNSTGLGTLLSASVVSVNIFGAQSTPAPIVTLPSVTMPPPCSALLIPTISGTAFFPNYNFAIPIIIGVALGLIVFVSAALLNWLPDPLSALRNTLHHKSTSNKPQFYYFTSPFKLLSPAQIAFYVLSVLALGTAFYFCYSYVDWLYYAFNKMTWARALGWLSFATLMLVTLPVSRRSVWILVFGISYERAIRFHRQMGNFAIIVLLVHGCAMIFSYCTSNPYNLENGCDYLIRLGDVTNASMNLPALVSGVLFLIMFLTSFEQIRRRAFWLFKLGHILFLPAMVGVMLHQNLAIGFVMPGLGLWFLDLLLAVWDFYLRPAVITKARVYENLVHLKIVKTKFTFEPGQFVLLLIPRISIEPHPFTISSAPLAKLNVADDAPLVSTKGSKLATFLRLALGYSRNTSTFSLHIKKDGPWTSRLHLLADLEYVLRPSSLFSNR